MRVQVRHFELSPLETDGDDDGHGGLLGGAAAAAAARPPFTGGEPKMVELIEGEMLEGVRLTHTHELIAC